MYEFGGGGGGVSACLVRQQAVVQRLQQSVRWMCLTCRHSSTLGTSVDILHALARSSLRTQ